MSTTAPSVATLIAVAALSAGRASAEPAPRGPVWDATIGASAGFDSNVYLVEYGPLANRESSVGTLSARVGAKFASGVALSYSALATKFSEANAEDNIKQTLAASWTRKLDAWSWNAATELVLVDGDDRGVDYGSGNGSAFSTAAPRERRDQFQNKTDLVVRHDTGPGFVRAIGKLQHWDMRTDTVNKCDYVDRDDIQGGLDLGRSLAKAGTEAYLGYRRGFQFQDNDFSPNAAVNASNHYDRYFVGLEAPASKTIKINAQAGWAKHSYNADYAGSAHEEGLFTDITVAWAATRADELQLKTSQARTFSTTGKNSILSTVHQLSWKHAFDAAWSGTLSGRVAESEYAPFARDDLDYAATASLTWSASKNLSCTAAVSQDWGRNHLNDLAAPLAAKREFDRSFVSIGVAWKL